MLYFNYFKHRSINNLTIFPHNYLSWVFCRVLSRSTAKYRRQGAISRHMSVVIVKQYLNSSRYTTRRREKGDELFCCIKLPHAMQILNEDGRWRFTIETDILLSNFSCPIAYCFDGLLVCCNFIQSTFILRL